MIHFEERDANTLKRAESHPRLKTLIDPRAADVQVLDQAGHPFTREGIEQFLAYYIQKSSEHSLPNGDWSNLGS